MSRNFKFARRFKSSFLEERASTLHASAGQVAQPDDLDQSTVTSMSLNPCGEIPWALMNFVNGEEEYDYRKKELINEL